MPDPHAWLLAYDTQLRGEAETPGATSVTRLGPLRLVTFAPDRGFVTYRDLGDAPTERGITELVRDALAHFRADAAIARVEWKTRAHDHAPGLHDALLAHGFVAEETESIMVGPAASLVADVALPPGVTLRRVTSEADVRAMSAMQDEVFGDPVSETSARSLLRRLSRDDGMQLWVAESGDEIVCAGRLEPVAGSDFAGVWGGCTREPWRGRGIYRALTAARAREAVAMGRSLVHSDSTAFSRPILERAGLVAVSSTTPYHWRR